MFQAFKEIADNVRETGFDLAAKAVTGIMNLYRELAVQVEEQTGFTLPLAGNRSERSSCSGFSGEQFYQDRPAESRTFFTTGAEAPEKAMDAVSSVPDAEAEKKNKKVKEKKEPPAESKAGAKKSPEKPKKRTVKKRVTKKRATNKSGAQKTQKKKGRKNQLARVLELLNEDGATWKSASELADASAEQGTRILPGNVRKVIRMRGEKYIETRPRADSRRGSLEYHITPAGLKYLQESENK